MESNVSLKEMDEKLGELARLEKEMEQLDGLKKTLQESIGKIQRDIMASLEAADLKTFKGGSGAVTVCSRWSVKMPKDPEVKDELRKELEEKEAFDGLWTINHQTLNSFWKAEKEACEQRGELVDLPGLNPIEDKYLQFRKG